MNKKQLRQIYRQKRAALPAAYCTESSAIIVEKLRPYLQDKLILSYYPFNSEADISAINNEYQAAYPVILNRKEMAAYRPLHDRFIKNRFGISEPDITDAELISPHELQLIIVPLLAFNEDCCRLGYGGGYYDRYLQNTRALKIGIAYEIQKTDQQFSDPYDIPLDLIISEKTIYFNQNAASARLHRSFSD